MFWRFGGYANISTIDTLLDKPDVTLEELLDESDLIQELKSHNTKLIEYLREDSILERLLEYVIAPKPESIPVVDEDAETTANDANSMIRDSSPSSSRRGSVDLDDEKEKKRNRYAYVAAEILSSDSWSLSAALLENQPILRKFWDFIKLPPALDPLQASYFTKVNEALLDKKTEEMLELFRSIDGVVTNMLQHVDSPMIMDLLLKIISLEKVEGGQGIVDWLHSQDLMPILLGFMSSEHSWATQTSAGDFLKAIITISANASQNEQSCIGPNELTRQLVSQACVEKLINDMLRGGNPLTVGVGIVIEVIRKNNSDYDPEVGSESVQAPSSRDPIYLGTLLRMFAKHVPDFMALILSPNHTIGGGDGPVTIRRKELSAAFGSKIEPLGFDRFKTCELMAELLHCSNMGLLNEVGSEDFVRARDLERERLKAEGKLTPAPTDRRGSLNDDLIMRSSTAIQLNSVAPDEIRKLEVQNASDDDGFEEVTHSGDLGDDPKDDFDEKPDTEGDLLTATKANQDASLSFLDKDDEEFVDEPLSSPRLNAESDSFRAENIEDAGFSIMPLSPTKELSQEIDSLSFEKSSSLDEEHTISPSSESAIENQDATNNHEVIPSLEVRGLNIPSIVQQQDGSISPHPEDKPAPLFAKKSTEGQNTVAPDVIPIPQDVDVAVHHFADSTDTTMADAGDISNSLLADAVEDQSIMVASEDIEIPPVVGDYLKMQFVEHKVVPTILDFFFRFPWNNFLHNVVYDVVQQVFNGPMDRGFNRTLAVDLFDTGNITMRIVDGQKKSDDAQNLNRMRLGYMGHLTLIAEEVVKFTERHPPELLSDSVLEKVMNGEWITYVEVTLSETRERDNAILGGVRPDMSVGPRQAVMNAVNAAAGFGSGSSALADAGLNGSSALDGTDLTNGNGTAGGGFTLTGGSLSSGFGSSSDDEEDEEMDEDNDDEGARISSGAEFSRYISTPLTTTATSNIGSELEPPLAPPPPPPPLNIPPSRARRQLAARLALHSKQSSDNTILNDNDVDLKISEQRKDLNPFAADEDDDEDGQGDFTIGDLEVVAEGQGHLPPGTALTGQQAALDELDLEIEEVTRQNNHVGTAESSIDPIRTNFPSLWPFGQQNTRPSSGSKSSAPSREQKRARDRHSLDATDSSDILQNDRNHDRGANADGFDQSSDDSDDDDSDDDGFGAMAGITGAAQEKGRRPSTTEATRRTSLEDDDDDEVVHVGLGSGAADDEEMIEVQHAEGHKTSHAS